MKLIIVKSSKDLGGEKPFILKRPIRPRVDPSSFPVEKKLHRLMLYSCMKRLLLILYPQIIRKKRHRYYRHRSTSLHSPHQRARLCWKIHFYPLDPAGRHLLEHCSSQK
jgi:hypothetical protein